MQNSDLLFKLFYNKKYDKVNITFSVANEKTYRIHIHNYLFCYIYWCNSAVALLYGQISELGCEW